jgi:GntR family transcriptional regulator
MTVNSKLYFQIAANSGVPIYRQIFDQVKLHVATGKFQADDFLPSVRQVATDLEINPMTISKAYSLLEKEGVVAYVRGTGMKILPTTSAQADLKDKEDVLKPLLKEVATRASQLSLEPKKVSELLLQTWKELENE